ncbi:hypothetical protein I4U23_014992 [Adineta vaga]|nr:hypothetical protein I4U23_014992 [Adineta vaga]
MNTTTTTAVDSLPADNVEDYRLVGLISLIFTIISVMISTLILILVWRTKPRLHTVNHLLICNTAFASIFYCVTLKNNFAYVIFGQWDTNDVSCRFRAYFAYSGIAGVLYSYLIQAISRFFFSVLSINHRYLTSFTTHYILIACQWIVVFLVTTPSILTTDINFYPHVFCWVPMNHMLHVVYTISVYYIIPVTVIIIIYICIYIQVKRAGINTTVASRSSQKRDLELLRRIMILLSIYLTIGILTVLFIVTSSRLIYFASLVWPSVCVTIEKLCTILLDREIYQVIQAKMDRVPCVSRFRRQIVPVSGRQDIQVTRQVNI